MFNVGGGEILVIALIALIVLGPERLPDAARQVGKTMGELRRLSSGFQTEIKQAFDQNDADPAPAPRRDVLSSPPAMDAGPPTAVASVSAQRPARRTPLKADPVAKTKSAPTAAKPARTSPPAAKGSTRQKGVAAKPAPAKRTDPVPKAPRPRSKGS